VSVKYVLTYHSADDFAARARELYPAHQARFRDFHARGLLLMIGTLAGEPAGDAMAIFTTQEAAEDFAQADPFVLQGVVAGWSIRAWNEALF
jgi:hypothetical protein